MKNTKVRIGIFFGGPSREREVSFAGGRTVYDNLDKTLFDPIPVFVDSLDQWTILDWQNIYKGTIRDFYPTEGAVPASSYSHYIESFFSEGNAQYEEVRTFIGQPMAPQEAKDHIDFAFLALHGRYGEDGLIQSQLTQLGIPYSGSGILASAIGINKAIQKKLMAAADFVMPKMRVIERASWISDPTTALKDLQYDLGNKYVIRPAHQGSSIGVTILESPEEDQIKRAIDHAFFIKTWRGKEWQGMTTEQKEHYARSLPDVKENLGFPLFIQDREYLRVEEVIDRLEGLGPEESVCLQAGDRETLVIVEDFIEGREFSCIVLRDTEGNILALPPTEIVKHGHLYDYRSKYLPGFSRKVTPIDLPDQEIERIMAECERLFDYLGFACYARIDGFYTPTGQIILNDPNTTSGMMPSSFFFHQAAEIGLNPSQFLTFIIHSSLVERGKEVYSFLHLEKITSLLVEGLREQGSGKTGKIPIGVIFGGYSYERHISVESGRNIYEKLSSSTKYQPLPLFLQRKNGALELVHVPIPLLLKDNADDIKERINDFQPHALIHKIQQKASNITRMYAVHSLLEPQIVPWTQLSALCKEVFIALHGRPGEDGALQTKLDKLGILYNGSSAAVSSITINKFDTLQFLSAHGFQVAEQMVLEKEDYLEDKNRWINSIEGKFSYPFIVKPVDDGCSSAVMKVEDQSSLMKYLDLIFRGEEGLSPKDRQSLQLDWNEEFPMKEEVLLEELIRPHGAERFIEITCGVMSRFVDGKEELVVFEPSEAIASKDILSLEEKFLAGQGMNITPARLATARWSYDHVVNKVKADLRRASLLLGIQGYARIDAFVRIFTDGRVETIIIEFNSLPGMTPATCIYHQAAIEGLKPFDFIDKIMTFALESAKK